MRGDSLRDLYAKTLALVGLALLAGIGALVDYWPTGGLRTPAVMEHAQLGVPSLPTAIPISRIQDTTVPVTPLARAEAAPALVEIVPALADVAVMSSRVVPATGASVALAGPPLRGLAAPVPVADVPAAEIALSVPEPLLSLPLPEVTQLMSARAEEGRGFLMGAAGAAKKAGATIAHGTVKAGSTIATGTMKAGAPLVGVVRVLGGAFKRLKFF